MNLKNYTSNVSVSKSVRKIEKFLAEVGATKILKEYENRILVGMSFEIPTDDIMLPIRIPANINKVCAAMLKEVKRPQQGTEKRIKEQAERTAWKTVHEWIVIQCQMVFLDQAELKEVFMPYIWLAKEQKTFFQKAVDTKFLLPK